MKNKLVSRLKIVHLISGDLWAGAETMAYNLLRRLKDYDDLDISVILFNEGRLADKLRASGLAVCVIDEKLNSFRKIVQKVRESIKNYLPDIIHSHRYKENFLAFFASRGCREIRLVSTQHGLPEFHTERTPFIHRQKMRANFFALSRYFITVAVSQDIRRVLIDRFSFQNSKTKVIHNGIDLTTLPPRGERSGPFTIGSSGRLVPVKDFPLMVEIARSVAETGVTGVRFELAGEGPGHSSLKSLIHRYGLNSSFILKGHLDCMNAFYQGLDVYLNTSVHEGIPMTILEALSHGLPVIAPAVGGISEVIDDGKEGFLIDSRIPADFAEKCIFLKDNTDECKKMGMAARMKVERTFSSEKMAEEYYRLYRRTVFPTCHC